MKRLAMIGAGILVASFVLVEVLMPLVVRHQPAERPAPSTLAAEIQFATAMNQAHFQGDDIAWGAGIMHQMCRAMHTDGTKLSVVLKREQEQPTVLGRLSLEQRS